MSTLPSTIMVLEDSDVICELFELLFAEHTTIKAFTTCRAARQWIRTNVPDLVILDYCLPDGNGFDFIHTMKSDERLKQVPIIFMSEYFSDSVHIGGVLGRIRKPIDINTLVDNVQRMWNDRSLGG